MKKELKKSARIALVLVSAGLMISLLVFFLLFGSGLQILMPLILFCIFFVVFLILEGFPFIRKHFVVKLIIAVVLILAFKTIL